MKCPACAGTGKVRDIMWEETDPCSACKGTGIRSCGEVFNDIGDTKDLVLKFRTREAALLFKSWLCDGGGSSSLYNLMEAVGDDITPEEQIEDIVYHTGDNTILFR